MKKQLLIIAVILALAVCLKGCGTTYQEATGQTESKRADDFANGYFTVITIWSDSSATYRIVYANDTKVKYLTIRNGYRFGITPLYNADGTLQVYEGNDN